MSEEQRAEKCETCRFWEWTGNESELEESFGRCLRLPPTINLTAAKHFFGDSIGSYVNDIGMWPHTVAWGWCGEWQEVPAAKKTGCPKLRTPRFVADELGLPPWGFKKIRFYARHAGVQPAAMADNIPLYDRDGVAKMRAWIMAVHPNLINRNEGEPS